MWELIGGVITLIIALLGLYLRQQKKKGMYEADKAKFDKALADRDAAELSAMFDELRKPGGSDSSRQDDKNTTERKLRS